jgi:hypothetical protein
MDVLFILVMAGLLAASLWLAAGVDRLMPRGPR